MFYQIRKDDFLVFCQDREGGVLITLSRDNHVGKSVCFAAAIPGNLYMLSENQWILVDSKGLVPSRKFSDYMRRTAAAMVIAVTRLPIGNSYLKLEPKDIEFIEAICYDLGTSRPLSWLPAAAFYYIGNGKLVTVVSQKVTGEYKMIDGCDIRTSLKAVTSVSSAAITNPGTPQLVISPASTPTGFQSPVSKSTPKCINPAMVPVQIQTALVQKYDPKPTTPIKTTLTPVKVKKEVKGEKEDEPVVLPPVSDMLPLDPSYNPTNLYNKGTPTKSTTNNNISTDNSRTRYPDFYALVEARGRWKKEHPNWRQEMCPDFEEDFERGQRGEAEELKRKLSEGKRLKEENEKEYKRLCAERKLHQERLENDARALNVKENPKRMIPILQPKALLNDKGKEELYDDDDIDLINQPKVVKIAPNDKGKEELYDDDEIDTESDSENLTTATVIRDDFYTPMSESVSTDSILPDRPTLIRDCDINDLISPSFNEDDNKLKMVEIKADRTNTFDQSEDTPRLSDVVGSFAEVEASVGNTFIISPTPDDTLSSGDRSIDT